MENMGSGMEGLIGGTLRIIGTVKVAARAVNRSGVMTVLRRSENTDGDAAAAW